MGKKKRQKEFKLVVCEKCGYNNQPQFAGFFGTCLRCKNVIDPRAKFRYEMNKKLGTWRKEKKRERKITKNN